jgi:hypothetical protein
VLEQLALAAPLPERQRSQAEIEAEHERDKSAMNMMVLSFTGLLSDWAKRYKRLVLQLKVGLLLMELTDRKTCLLFIRSWSRHRSKRSPLLHRR